MDDLHRSIGRAAVVIVALAFGGAGPAAGPGDAESLGKVARAVPFVDASVLLPLVASGIGEADLGQSARCRELLRSFSGLEPVQQARLALEAAKACGAPCTDAAAKVEADPKAREALLRACDQGRPDPIFGGRLAGLRTEMEPGAYVLMRHELGRVREALLASAAKDARVSWETFSYVLGSLAVAMILNDRLGTSAAGPDAGVQDAREVDPPPALPTGQAPIGPPVIAVGADEVRLDGARVIGTDGAAGSPALRERLIARRDAFRKRAGAAKTPRVILGADAQVELRALRPVLRLCAELGFRVDLAVPVQNRWFNRIRWSGSARMPLVLDLPEAISSMEEHSYGGVVPAELARLAAAPALQPEEIPEWLKKAPGPPPRTRTVWIDPDGYTQLDREGDQAGALQRAGRDDTDRVQENTEGALKEIALVPDDAVRYGQLLRVVHAALTRSPVRTKIQLADPATVGPCPEIGRRSAVGKPPVGKQDGTERLRGAGGKKRPQ